MRRLLFAASVATLFSATASAQSIVSAKAGLIHMTEGTVLINGEAVKQNGDVFRSMQQSEVLSTERGRAEILLNAGTYLRVAEASSFELVSSDLEDTRLTLISGNALIEVADLPKDTSVTLSVVGSEIQLRKRGLYEFTADAPGKVRVYDGELVLTSKNDVPPVKVGKHREIELNALLAGPVKFDKEETTALYRWGARRARYIAQANENAATDMRRGQSTYGYVPLGSYRGVWAWNPFYGMYTYLPLSGFGYSPWGGIVLYSPATIWTRYATPTPIDMSQGIGRSAIGSPGYASQSSGRAASGAASVPVSSAPAVASPNTGGGGDGGRRR